MPEEQAPSDATWLQASGARSELLARTAVAISRFFGRCRNSAVSGVDVLDLDRKHIEAGAWWTANRDRLPPTRCHRTRSGGLHLLFRHAVGVLSTAGNIARGVDTRGDGGYIIRWPGAGLQVLNDTSPAARPEWLLARLGRHQRRLAYSLLL
jgi:hypothetical protein